ncbi:MAG TPA: DinB family protein [Thermomicrobiaceae bacterium]|nr:DinB family protein [Thermomicrobiaceae bacterium]
MANKQEIEDAIRQGEERVQHTFGNLTDEELNRVVHSGEGGWTAKEVLAHLAGRAQGYERTVQMAQSQAPAQPAGAGFDVDRWNRERIEERIHKSRDELLREFHAVHDDLIAKVHTLTDQHLERTVPRPTGDITVGEALARGGGQHAINHTIEVEQALGKEPPTS